MRILQGWAVLLCLWIVPCWADTITFGWDPYPDTVVVDHFVLHQYVAKSAKITRVARISPRVTSYTLTVPTPRTITLCWRLVPVANSQEGAASNQVCASWLNGVRRGP